MNTPMVKIKCPHCAAILKVKMQPGMENKNATCPVCKETSPYRSYRIITQSDDETRYSATDNGEHTEYAGAKETEFKMKEHSSLGRLKVSNPEGTEYRLNPGRNVIGRKASASSADFQIPVEGCRRMSREHLVIEVKKVPEIGYVHYASLYKQQVNGTFINKERLEFGDCIVLKSGDKIELPDVTLVFEIPDEEGADL